jgi:carbamoyltransferase
MAIAEEEKFIRVKTANGYFPINSIIYCLREGRLNAHEINYIAIGWDCKKYDGEKSYMKMHYDSISAVYKKDSITLENEKRILYKYKTDEAIKYLKSEMNQILNGFPLPEVVFYSHHKCHAASAFYCSDILESNIITVDGSGEEDCTVLWIGKGQDINEIEKQTIPNSLGWFYAMFVELLGFTPYIDEGKFMGLSSYGKYEECVEKKINSILVKGENGIDYKVNPYYSFYGEHNYGGRYTDGLVRLFDKYTKEKIFNEYNKCIAWSVQNALEDVIEKCICQIVKKTGVRNVCIAGGVGMNCKMNGKISELRKRDIIDKIFIQPLSYDSGTSLGAALLLYKELGGNPRGMWEGVYYGPRFTENEIKESLEGTNLRYKAVTEIELEVAKMLKDGKIIGWFQGRMEAGARALGNRSILANPFIKRSKDKVNRTIKKREWWRPFGPTILKEKASTYLKEYTDSPYMMMSFKIKEAFQKEMYSVIHIDGTCRPQILEREKNEKYYYLIEEFERLTGHSLILNTSFNIKGLPIVCSPKDAINDFLHSDIDALAIGDYLVLK